jgi:hypothetical protein
MNEPLIKITMNWDEFGCCGCGCLIVTLVAVSIYYLV